MQKGLGKSQSRKSGLTAIYLIELTRAALGTRRKFLLQYQLNVSILQTALLDFGQSLVNSILLVDGID